MMATSTLDQVFTGLLWQLSFEPKMLVNYFKLSTLRICEVFLAKHGLLVIDLWSLFREAFLCPCLRPRSIQEFKLLKELN